MPRASGGLFIFGERFSASVFIAAFCSGHPNHSISLEIVAGSDPSRSFCALHTLAEVYATMTALPVRVKYTPDHVMLFIEEIRRRFSLITLDEQECVDRIERTASMGIVSGQGYDSLLVGCAMKSRAEAIYTWNAKHFRATAPDLADRIRTP